MYAMPRAVLIRFGLVTLLTSDLLDLKIYPVHLSPNAPNCNFAEIPPGAHVHKHLDAQKTPKTRRFHHCLVLMASAQKYIDHKRRKKWCRKPQDRNANLRSTRGRKKYQNTTFNRRSTTHRCVYCVFSYAHMTF